MMRSTGVADQAVIEVPEVELTPCLDHVVFLTDMTARSDAGFDHARWLSEEFAYRLTVFHGVFEWCEASDGRPEILAEAKHRQEREARESLERMVEPLAVPTDVMVERPCSVYALAERLEALAPDLVVATTHGRGGMSRVARGSVVETIVRHGIAPLVALRQPDHGVGLRYRRLLVATDFSQASRRAFPIAALLADRFGCEVVAAYVSPTPRSRSVYGAPESVERTTPASDAVSRFLGPAFASRRTRSIVEAGAAPDKIVEIATRERSDLIVIARHSQHDFRSRILGGVAEEVLRRAPCPVLVVP